MKAPGARRRGQGVGGDPVAADADDFEDLLEYCAGIERVEEIERLVNRLPTPVRRRNGRRFRLAGAFRAGGAAGGLAGVADEAPRAVVTTTPRPVAALRAIRAAADTAETGGATAANPHLASDFAEAMAALYGGTRIGRQELEGELIEDVEGALWTRAMIEGARHGGALPREFRRIVVGVDPPASAEGDKCGIVVCAVDGAGTGWVLEDCSAAGLSPEGWARRVAGAAERWGADRVVAEKNNGGAMVESVLRGASVNLPVKPVHASEGKSARAEPVAALFERGAAKLAGAFPQLEDELCGLTLGGGYEGPGRSPDRADAMVWAMSELMLAPKKAAPWIYQL